MKVLLIGGGTGGHILPLKNLAEALLRKHAEVEIVVADSPLDRAMIQQNFSGIPIHFFKTGKIRRYFSLQNVVDAFLILKAVIAAKNLLKKTKPDVLFFKGGFVGFPFFVAVKFLMRFKGKIYSHESDISAGVLTKMVEKISHQTFRNFGNSAFPLFYTPPLRGRAEKPQQKGKNVLLLGGSQGAGFLNNLSLQCHDKLLEKYAVTLLTGRGKKVAIRHDNFEQFELLPASEIAEKISESDLVISRGGANSLLEIIYAKKQSIIIPLPSVARNHQLLNAKYFEKKGLCRVLEERHATSANLLKTIMEVLNDKKMRTALDKYDLHNAAGKIAEKMMGRRIEG